MSAADNAVAIIGMAGRFPGASSIEEFWQHLASGTESITRFDAAQLSPLVAPELRAHPRYVAARGVIAGAENFDAAFFGITPGEAQLMDPQQRVFLELCWNALEHAGLGAPRSDVSVGVYAGVSNNGYRKLVEAHPELVAASGEFAAMLANEKDYVATREELEFRANAVLNAVADGTLKLRIEHIYSLSDAAHAHRDLEGRKTTGKLLLIP
jgi:acyl transferase domain-containing protein